MIFHTAPGLAVVAVGLVWSAMAWSDSSAQVVTHGPQVGLFGLHPLQPATLLEPVEDLGDDQGAGPRRLTWPPTPTAGSVRRKRASSRRGSRRRAARSRCW